MNTGSQPCDGGDLVQFRCGACPLSVGSLSTSSVELVHFGEVPVHYDVDLVHFSVEPVHFGVELIHFGGVLVHYGVELVHFGVVSVQPRPPLSGGLQPVRVVELVDPCVFGDRIGKRDLVGAIDDDPLSLSGISREEPGFRF